MPRPMPSLTLLALALAQPLSGRLAQLTGRGVSIERRSDAAHGAVTPAKGAFAIWGPIFAGGVAFALRSFRKDAARVPADRRLMLMNGLAFAGNSAWALQAQAVGLGWRSVAIISATAAAAVAATIDAETRRAHSAFARFASRTSGPLAGWLTVASFANLDATLVATRRSRDDETRRAVALVGAAGATAALMAAATRGNAGYVAASAWGLGAIALRNQRESRGAVVLTATLGLAAVAAATIFARRFRRS